MKAIIQAYFISATIILMLAILVSLIIGALFFFHITDTNITNILVWILGILVYFIAGAIFGHYIENRILIHILLVGILFFIFFITFSSIQGFTIVRIGCKFLAFCIAAISIKTIQH